MTVNTAPVPRPQFTDLNGNPYVGGKLFTYAEGSTTKLATYTTVIGDVANTNPIILDAEGRVPHEVRLLQGSGYKFVLAPSTDTDPPTSGILLGDYITGNGDSSTTFDQWIDTGYVPTFISTTSFSVPGDKTNDFLPGRRIKLIQGGSTIYGTISSSVYTSLTTVSVELDSGSINSGILSVLIGVITATNTSIPSGKIISSIRTSNTKLDISDNSKIISSSGVFIQTFQPSSTLENGWHCIYLCTEGHITLDPDSTELINGVSTLTLYSGDSYIISCTGTGFNAHRLSSNIEYNAIVNGGFRVWNEGNTFTSIATGTTFAECFKYVKVGTGVVDITRTGAAAPIVTLSDVTHIDTALINVTTADTAIAAGDIHDIVHAIEGYRFAPMIGKLMTLSFLVKCSKIGIYSVSLRNTAQDQSIVFEYTIDVADTWEQKTINFPITPTTGSWNYTTGIGLYLAFALMTGSTYKTATLSQWQAGNYVASSNQVNFLDAINNNFSITGIKLQPGTIATRFVHDNFDDELRNCYRYFWKGLPTLNMVGFADAASRNVEEIIRWPVQMRDVPDVTGSVVSGATYSNCAYTGFGSATVSGARFYVTSAAAGNLSATFTLGTHYFQADARL